MELDIKRILFELRQLNNHARTPPDMRLLIAARDRFEKKLKRIPQQGNMTADVDGYKFKALWSVDDEQYVGLCEQYPSLSWLADTQIDALEGIENLVMDTIKDEADEL